MHSLSCLKTRLDPEYSSSAFNKHARCKNLKGTKLTGHVLILSLLFRILAGRCLLNAGPEHSRSNLVFDIRNNSNSNHSPNFSLSEVRDAISELKEGMCIDPVGFVREIFTRAGTELVQSIVTMLNMIKKKWQVPSRWAEMYICTLYKQKGS